MPYFENIHIRKLDVTLLLVFEAAMDSGKLTVAAGRLGLTQSAVSHALKRLRDVFDDELFIRTPHGVRPTERALALRGGLKEALQLIAGAVQAPRFDPANDQRIFRIAAPDYETSLFAPLLTRLVRGTAGLRFVFQPLIRRQAIDGLKSGEVELLLGYTLVKDNDCELTTLYDEDYLVVARQGHPALAKTLTLAGYTKVSHVLVAPDGSLSGVVDGVLAKHGRTRHVAVAVPYFLSALATVAQSDLIATLPRRLVQVHAAHFAVQTTSPPITIRRFPVSMIWSRRLSTDPASVWLRKQITQVAASLR